MKSAALIIAFTSMFGVADIALAAPPAPVTTAHKPKAYNQVHMEAALRDLAAAKKELEVANHDKDDMRIKAMGLVDQAVAAVNQGISDAGGEAKQ